MVVIISVAHRSSHDGHWSYRDQATSVLGKFSLNREGDKALCEYRRGGD